MFGFSFAELILLLLVALIFIRPKDLPEIAHLLGRGIFHGKILTKKIRGALAELEKDAAVQELRNEINRGLAEEKAKNDSDEDSDFTIIVDMYGNEHRVNNIGEIRQDIDQEKLAEEIAVQNQKNLAKISEKLATKEAEATILKSKDEDEKLLN